MIRGLNISWTEGLLVGGDVSMIFKLRLNGTKVQEGIYILVFDGVDGEGAVVRACVLHALR